MFTSLFAAIVQVTHRALVALSCGADCDCRRVCSFRFVLIAVVAIGGMTSIVTFAVVNTLVTARRVRRQANDASPRRRWAWTLCVLLLLAARIVNLVCSVVSLIKLWC